VALIVAALGVFYAAGRNQYTLVLAPEGVPTISVSYWAFLAPALGWLGAGLLGWRFCDLLLGPGRGILARTLRPLSGNLAPSSASMMSRQSRVIARSAVLVGLALSFAISTATFNSTYRQQAVVDAQLTNGADVTVNESPGSSVTAGYARHLAGVSGVTAVQPMLHRFAYVGADLQDLYGINPRTITRATSLQDPYFQGAGAQTMLHRLANRPDGALVSAETVLDYQLRLGDQLRLRLQNGRTHAYRTVTFHYVGIVNEFPTAPKDSFIVANADYVARATGSPAVGTFLVSTGGHDVPAVASRVRNEVGTTASVGTINDARGLVGSSLTSVNLTGLTRLELGFALVIAAAAGGLVMGLGLNERRRTVAVVTAIGATRRQLRRLNNGEPLFVVVMGLLGGLLGGWALSYLLVKVLNGVFDPPPAALAVPWVYLMALVVVTVLAIAGASATVSRNTRLHAREYLREM
jgi:putative ABC transport system permease protein